MQMKSEVKILKTIFIACLIVLPGFLFAQGGFPQDVVDNPVPFDGGVSLLLAAGIGYGIKKARNNRKLNQE